MPAFSPADDLIPAIGYIRVSMAREEMISPELQRTAILRWAKRTNHRIIDWVEDLDKTGRNFKRKVMRVIERVEAGEAQVIAVWKYSRFGRTRTGVPANLARVEKVGGQLLSATEEVDARTAIGRFQRGMIMEFNAFESDRSGEQWMETHQWRREQGLPATGGKRFGYIWYPRKVYAPDGSITMQQERYEPDPDTRGVAEDLYKRYIAGEGFRNLAVALNDADIRTAQGTLWSPTGLRLYMDSGFAAGYLRVHDDACKITPYSSKCPAHVLIKHPTKGHTPLISDKLWQQYLERRAFTKTASPRSRNARYPLSALSKCGLGSHAARRSTNGRGYASFVCDARSRKGTAACEGFQISISVAEDAVRAWLAKLADEVDDATRGGKPSSAWRPAETHERQRDKAKQVVEKIERAIAKHMRVYAMSEGDDPDGTLEREYLKTLRGLKAEKAAAVEKLAGLEEPPPEVRVAELKAAAAPVARGLIEEWDSLKPERINAILRQIIARVDIFPGQVVQVVPNWDV